MKNILTFVVAALLCLPLTAKDIDLAKFGAKADGKTKVTKILQKAIDKVSEAGGGAVILTGGKFLTGAVELKSGVELRIDADAVLLGSPDLEDYPNRAETRHFDGQCVPRWRNIALIYADQADNIAITGRGTIDCNGDVFVAEKKDTNWTWWQYDRIVPYEKSVPRACFFAGCSNVRVVDVTMINQPAGWSYWVHDCDYVWFDRCKIYADVRYPNNDGIHINSSRNVTVANCIIECGDDALVLRANNRSLKENKVCEYVTVTNCVLRSWSSGVRIGWTNDGVIRNCTFSNIVMWDTSNAISCFLPNKKINAHTNDFGREATLVENLTFSNIQMKEIYGCPIYVYVGRDTEDTFFAGFRNVTFNNIQCTSLRMPYFNGREDGAVENVSFNDCTFEQMPESAFPLDKKQHGAALGSVLPIPKDPVVNVRNMRMNNSNFIIQ